MERWWAGSWWLLGPYSGSKMQKVDKKQFSKHSNQRPSPGVVNSKEEVYCGSCVKQEIMTCWNMSWLEKELLTGNISGWKNTVIKKKT